MMFQGKKSLLCCCLVLLVGQGRAFRLLTNSHDRTRITATALSAERPNDVGGDQVVTDVRKQKIKRNIDWEKIEDEEDEHTPTEAQTSASLYMNPATERIAEGIKVSWEPEVAEIIRRLERR